MPQNKNLTQICFSEGGFGGRNGVVHAREKGAYQGNKQAVPKSGEKRKDRNSKRAGQNNRLQPQIRFAYPRQFGKNRRRKHRRKDGQGYGFARQAAERGRQEAEILRRICNRFAEDMGILLVPVRKNTGPLHAGADGFFGRAVSHNGKRQGITAIG